MPLCIPLGLRHAPRTSRNGMKTPRSLRLVLACGLLGSALLASPALALTSAEFEAHRAKAAMGNTVAQYNLGLAYADRRESIYDPVQAYAWLSIAAANGTNSKALSNLTSLLTPEQLEAGKRELAALTASPVVPSPAASSPIVTADESAAIPAPAPLAEAGPAPKTQSAELSAARKENELLKSGLTAQLADANKRVAIAEAALASKDKEISSLHSRLAAAPASPVIGISAELASLRTERDDLLAASKAASTELASLRASSAKAAAEQTALREKLARSAQAVANAERAQALAEAESASLKAAADRAGAERLAVAAQLETATAELEKAKGSPAAAPEGLSETGVAVLKADRDSLAATVKTLTEERDALTAQLAAAKAVIPVAPAPEVVIAPIPAVPTPPADTAPDSEASTRLADLEKAKAKTDTKLEAALRSFTLQQNEIDRLQKALASIDEERASNATKLEAALAELTTIRPQAATAASVSSDAETLRTQLASANQKILEHAAALEAANVNLADARKTVDTATADLVATRDQLRQTQAQSAAFAVENQQLKTRLALAGSLPAGTTPSRPGTLSGISINLPSVTVAPEPPAPAPTVAAEPRIHTVSSGDSLSRISKHYYGTANRWNDILQANKTVIRNPDSLTLGTKLRIP